MQHLNVAHRPEDLLRDKSKSNDEKRRMLKEWSVALVDQLRAVSHDTIGRDVGPEPAQLLNRVRACQQALIHRAHPTSRDGRRQDLRQRF
jgi:hypothetical protein